MSNRSVTGISTIPLGTAGSGTITASPIDARYVNGTGTNFLSLVETVKIARVPTNYWLFVNGKNELRRIMGITSDNLLLLDEPTTASGDTYIILLADLIKGWKVQNVGSAVGTVNGEALPANKEVNSGDYYGGTNITYSQPTWVNGTGTTLLITEYDKKP